MYNPKILSHSVQDVCLGEGEGCLSVDRDVPGYVVRHNKITVSYFDMVAKTQSSFKNYEAIVVQHEIDHINGIMFYDHINKENPFALKEGVLVIENWAVCFQTNGPVFKWPSFLLRLSKSHHYHLYL